MSNDWTPNDQKRLGASNRDIWIYLELGDWDLEFRLRDRCAPACQGLAGRSPAMTPSFTSLRGWLKPDEAISAGRYQIATRLSGARKDKKRRPRNDINDVGGDKPRPYKLTY